MNGSEYTAKHAGSRQEWGDLSHFPAFLRDGQTDFISFFANFLGVYKPLKPWVVRVLKSQRYTRIIDATAGAGGPVRPMFGHGKFSGKIQLSDRFPNLRAARWLEKQEPMLEYIRQSRDIEEISTKNGDLISCFNAFHHFDEAHQETLLEKWAEQGCDVLIAEVLEPNNKSYLSIILTGLVSFLLMPFVLPFRWDRLLFTYVIPILPISIARDGWVSIDKQPSKNRWKTFVIIMESRGYHCALKRVNTIMATTTYFIAEKKMRDF